MTSPIKSILVMSHILDMTLTFLVEKYSTLLAFLIAILTVAAHSRICCNITIELAPCQIMSKHIHLCKSCLALSRIVSVHAQREGLAVHGCTCKFDGSLVTDLQCSVNNVLCSLFDAVLLVRYSAPAMSAHVVQPCTQNKQKTRQLVLSF